MRQPHALQKFRVIRAKIFCLLPKAFRNGERLKAQIWGRLADKARKVEPPGILKHQVEILTDGFGSLAVITL